MLTYYVYFSFSYTEVVIGFDQESYRVSEMAEVVTITVRLISGELQTQVSVLFSTSSGSAVGKLL